MKKFICNNFHRKYWKWNAYNVSTYWIKCNTNFTWELDKIIRYIK